MELLLMLFGILVLPLVGALLIGLPVYSGIYASLYWVYRPADGSVHPLAGRFWEIGTMFAQYLKLVEHSGLILQVMLPPVAGLLVALALVYAFYRSMRGQFSVDGI